MRIGPTLPPLSLSNENQRRGEVEVRGDVWQPEISDSFLSACVSNVKGCQVFIENWMRGSGGCLTFGPAHSLSPITPPRGALRPVTSSRPRRRRSPNIFSFICLVKVPTFLPIHPAFFLPLVDIQCCSRVWLGSQKHSAYLLGTRAQTKKFGIGVREEQNVLIWRKVLTLSGGDKNLFPSS